MFDKIRNAVLILLAVLCITAYIVSFTAPIDRDNLKRSLASQDEFEFITQ